MPQGMPLGGKVGAVPRGESCLDLDQRYMGTVKSFNEKTSYGFITCEKLEHTLGKADIFVHANELGMLQVGQAASFSVELDKHGKPYAVAVTDADQGYGPPPQKR